MYDRTIALGFNWFEAENETNQRNGNLYRLEAVTHFSNGNTKPGKDGVSPRQYLCKKMNRVKDQKEVADAKKKEEKKAKSEMKAMIKMIKKAPSLFRDKRLSDPNFDIRKKISEADIARVEKEIKEVKAMQTVIPPASDFVSSRASTALVEHMSTSNTQQSLLFIFILHSTDERYHPRTDRVYIGCICIVDRVLSPDGRR